MQGENEFVSLMTGFSKSLCYAVLPGGFDLDGSVAIVASLLVNLQSGGQLKRRQCSLGGSDIMTCS